MPYYRCEERGCFNGNCGDCYDGKEYDVKFCGECDSETCIGCKLQNVTENIRTGVECCSACALDVIPLLLQQKTKLVKEVEETAKLRKEISTALILMNWDRSGSNKGISRQEYPILTK